MAYGPHRARLEAALARAHKNIWLAREAAESLGDEGLNDDLAGVQRILTEMAKDSLRGHKRPRPPEQTDIITELYKIPF